MKKLNIIPFLFSLLFGLTLWNAKGQNLTIEDFEKSMNFPGDYPGWSSGLPPFGIVTQNACEGNQTLRLNLFSQNTLGWVEYISPLPSTGEDVVISFDYKIVDKASGNLSTADFGQLDLLYSVDGGLNWNVYDIINQLNLPTADCSTNTFTLTMPNVPSGSIVSWRLNASFSINYPNQNDGIYLYIDDFRIVEQVSCIQPIKAYINESTISFDGAQLNWEDLNSAIQWEVGYCTTPGNPSAGNPLCFPKSAGIFTPIVVNNNPTYTFSGLNDGIKYYVYIRAVCGVNDKSEWVGPISFQTTAVGADCNVPIDVSTNDLPYIHTSNTDIYGSEDYFGSPGNDCGGISGLLNGYEVVYRFNSTSTDILTVDVTGLTGAEVGVFSYNDCAEIGTICVDGDITSTGSDLQINSLYVNPGEDYYIVIASLGPNSIPANTQYTIHIRGFDCSTWVVPDGDANLSFLAGQTLSHFSGFPNYGITPSIDGAILTWYEDNNGTQGNVIPNLNNIVLSDGDTYWVTQSVFSCESPGLLVTFNEFDCSVDLTGITSSQGDSVCQSGSMTLQATSTTGEIHWYQTANSLTVLGKGNTFTTPALTQTTSFWASETYSSVGFIEHQGMPGPISPSLRSTNNIGMQFVVTERMILVDTQVFVTEAGNNITVELQDTSGNVVKGPLTIPITGGSIASPQSNILPLNWDLDPGTYSLIKKSGPQMLYENIYVDFPYPLGSSGEIITSLGTAANGYYYFFNWTIIGTGALCESARTEVVATVYDIVSTEVSADDLQICAGTNTDLHVNSTDTDYVYDWIWTDGMGTQQTATGMNITVSPTQNTTYTVTATNPISNCQYVNDIFIEVYGADTLPVAPTQMNICKNEILELTAGGVKYDFNDAFNTGWTTINNSLSTYGSTTSANWHVVDSPHSVGGISSNDDSRFYISVADSLGTGGVLDTELISPSLNTVGLNALSVSFYHYFNFIETQKTIGTVDVSLNNGPWQTVQTYDGGPNGDIDLGSPTKFTFETVDLSNYVGKSDLRIRFHYTGGWGWSWAIDNVVFNLGYTNGYITWSPHNNLYLDEQTNIAYNGEPARKVYFKNNQAGVFNYTTTLNITDCGVITENISVTVQDTPKPTGDLHQIFEIGDIIYDLVVNGQNLIWYIQDANGDFVPISVNTPLQHGETYYVSQTLNGCESELLGITVSFHCPAPSNVQINSAANGTTADAIITWTHPQDISGVQNYYVKIEDSNGGVVYDSLISVTQDYVVIQGLQISTNYTLTIYSVCDSNIPVYSDSFSLDFKTMRVNNFGFEELNYSPNPTPGIVYFENSTPFESISVYDLSGKEVLHKQLYNKNKITVDFSNFSNGVYMVALKTGKSISVVKVIKQ